MYPGLVVADDRTGANDAGNEFAARGIDTEVWGYEESIEGDPDVLVVDTDTRDSGAELAAERVGDAIETHAAGVVYKKIDSTLRGNLVAEIEAALEATAASTAVVAPAFPAAGRTTAGGFHLVDGEPVAATSTGASSESRSSHLPTRLAAASVPVEHLSLDVIGEGIEAIEAALADVRDTHDSAVVACDATQSRHLGAIGRAAAGGPNLCVGSAGLAAHLPLRSRQPSAVVGVVGSLAPETRAQLEAVDDDLVVRLEAGLAVREPASAVQEATTALAATLDREGTAVLATSDEPTRTDATDGSVVDAAETVATALGETVATLRDTERVDGLFLTGGDVAGAVLSALDARGVRLTGHAVDDGVPVGEIVAGPESGTTVVTKAGGFGAEETIVNCLDFLRRHDG